MNPLPIVVLISGRGSNLQAIIDAKGRGLPVDICAVISNIPDVLGLERAEQAGIEALTLQHTAFADRESFDRTLVELIDGYAPELVVLAGFMRILSPDFIRHYEGRLINIHPSLLPDFPGLNTHQRVLDAGEEEHGASVHFVTDEVDGGPVIIQARVPVLAGDDAETLAARVLEHEHRILPEAIGWFAEGRLQIEGDRVLLDGQPVQPGAAVNQD